MLTWIAWLFGQSSAGVFLIVLLIRKSGTDRQVDPGGKSEKVPEYA
ncbi:hypothetical protein HMPREF1862_01067 [Varibaculum cambriense]|uniref:Uncharacterized protein n=1 Tax=Varibaculum cambriense TaxID=184870 RepID=A0AB34WZD7_9ACTO|nr:hypothetical protein HMPREF1862_01067 [Varibaculum cambriense]